MGAVLIVQFVFIPIFTFFLTICVHIFLAEILQSNIKISVDNSAVWPVE